MTKVLEKALLILDIDETLIYANSTKLEYPHDTVVFDYYIYLRPYLKQFLDSVKLHYHLALWSSASDDYVELIVQNTILKKYNFKFIWGKIKSYF